MAVLKWNRLIGQERIKSVIGRAFEKDTLGHAYLFCGSRGVGKFAAALDMASALLCSVGGARSCGECPSCKKVAGYAHPDFHVIMPLVTTGTGYVKDGQMTEDGWAFAAESVKSRIGDPYRIPRHEGVNPGILVDWIREANDAIWRGATEGAANVVIIDGVETMKKESANAMLKTLEEPPSGTVMILLTDSPHAVLPTIVSRCQIMRFPLLPAEEVAAELGRRFGTSVPAAKVEVAAACGSIGAAIEELEGSMDSYYEAAASLWNACLRGEWEAMVRVVDRLSGGGDAASMECRSTIASLIRLLRFAFLHKFKAPINYISLGMTDFIELPETAEPKDVERYVKLCEEAQGALTRWNGLMVMANFACTLMEMLNGEE